MHFFPYAYWNLITIHIQYFKQNPVGKLYERLGFVPDYEKDYHYVMIKPKDKELKR